MKRKITIYYIENQQTFAPIQFECLLKKIPSIERKKTEKFYFKKDREIAILSKSLLSFILNKNTSHSLDDLYYSPYNKPYIKDDFSFNLSHSGNFVILACSNDKAEIGIDIEKITSTINIDDFKSTLNFNDQTLVHNSNDPFQTFYNIWTIKEAIIKANGKGLSIPLTEINIINENSAFYEKNWHIKKITIHNQYSCHIASNKEFEIIKIQPLNIEQLLK